MIEVDGIKLYTEREWERKHRHVLKRQLGKGVTRTWRATPGNVSATWYRKDQTRPWTEAERRRERRERKAKLEAKLEEKRRTAEKAAIDRARSEGRCEAEDDLLWRICGAEVPGRSHTAWQWVSRGFVPIAEARWHPGDPEIWQSADYDYCEAYDVRYDPDRAAELLETGPREVDRLPDGRPYDGRPWW